MYGIRNLTTWDPFGPLERLQAEFERSGLAATRAHNGPSVDVWSEGDDLRLRALIPGLEPEHLEIHVRGDTLTLRGQVDDGVGAAGDRWLRRERAGRAFTRTLQLPFAIDADGVLEMELPRSAAEKPRRIPVQHSRGGTRT